MAIVKTVIIKVDDSQAGQKVGGLTKDFKKLNTEVSKTNKELSETGKTAKKTAKDTEGVGTSALSGIKNFKVMGVSINSVSKSLKFLKISLIATGIGAILVAVGALAAAFLSTQAGVDALNSVLKPLGAVLATIWGIVQKLGAGLFKMVSGDIKGGFEDMGKAVEGFGDQMDAAWQRGKKLAELMIAIEERAVTQGLVLSRLNRHLAEQLRIAEDVTKTEKERKDAFNNAIAAQVAMNKLKKAELDELIKAILIGEEDNDTNRKAQKERNDLIAQRETIEANGIRAITLLEKKRNVVKVEGVVIDKEATAEEIRKAKIINEAIKAEEKRQVKLADIKQKFADKELDQDAKTQLQKLKLDEQRELDAVTKLVADIQAKKDANEKLTKVEIQTLIDSEERKKEIRSFFADEQLEIEKENIKKHDAELKTLLDKIREETEVERIQREKEIALEELERLKGTLQERNAIIEFYDNKIQDSKDKDVEAEQRRQDQVKLAALQSASQMFAGLANLAKEGSKEQEALAIAATLTSAAVAAIGIWEGYAKFGPFGIAGAIAQSIALAAATVTAIAQIKSASSGVSGRAPGGTPRRSPNFSIAGTTQATTGGQVDTQDVVATSQQTPIKVYVTASDVTTQQALERQIVNNATIVG